MEDDSMKNCHIKVLCKYMYKHKYHSIQWHNVFINSVLSNLFDGLRGTVLIKHGNN